MHDTAPGAQRLETSFISFHRSGATSRPSLGHCCVFLVDLDGTRWSTWSRKYLPICRHAHSLTWIKAKAREFFAALTGRPAMRKMSIIGILMGAAMVCAAPISLNQSPDKGLSLSLNSAQARIGRPLTPGSIAGVNRRVHRRAYRRCAYGVTCY